MRSRIPAIADLNSIGNGAVDQNDIRWIILKARHGIAYGYLRDDLDVLGCQRTGDPGTDERLIVDYGYPDHGISPLRRWVIH